ncbi:MAG: hypothetical protein ACXWW2_10290 [Candidatus Deferrimicrobiaceae bacterium]
MQTDDPRQVELLARIREGVDNALAVVGEIDRRLLACSNRLRVDPSDDTFTALSSEISNLDALVALVQEIKNGVAHLAARHIPADFFSSMEKSLPLFQQMQAAMVGKDWVTLADLIQYELSPLLADGEKDLSGIRDILASS